MRFLRPFYQTILMGLLFGLANGVPARAQEKPVASFRFTPVADGVLRDAAGGPATASVTVEEGDGWVDTDRGPALELRGPKDAVTLSPEAFAGLRGAVRVTFRAALESERPQILFRVYHPGGDGLVLHYRRGELSFRYYNRADKTYVTASLPAEAAPLGEWTTVTAAWDLEAERLLTLAVPGRPEVKRKVPETMRPDFEPDSQVRVGNEHSGGSPFLGALLSVECFASEPPPVAEQARVVPEQRAEVPKVAHRRRLPQTLFFTRTQPKYDLFSNPLQRRWVDRPLFFDRRTEASERPYNIVSSASFLRTQEILRDYGFNGVGSLLGSVPWQGTAFLEMLDTLEKSAPAHPAPVPLVMEVSGYDDSEKLPERLRLFLPLARRALASPHVLRVGGKVLVLSYAVDRGAPSGWAAFQKAVREELGDQFLFVADVTLRRPSLLREFQSPSGIGKATLESFRAHLREWLDVSDGLMWAGGSHTNRPDGTFDRAFYQDWLIPVFHGILAEAPYQGKLLGLDAEVGYINVMTSRRINPEEGTSRLRDGLEMSLQAQADFIAMPEWDELNENTSVGPTLTNSLSTLRIVRHHVDRAAGREPAPLPGDDPTVPNLVVSLRPYLKLGERLEVEVLAIPDGSAPGPWKVELALKALDGRVVEQFEAATLAGDGLAAHRFALPSERLAAEPVVRPSLKVTAANGTVTEWEAGLEAIRLFPTWNLNYKATKVPLRDLLRPVSATFELKPGAAPGEVIAKGRVVCDEPISTVEVVQDSRELYAVDPRGELAPREGEALVMLQWQAMRNPMPFEGSISVENGTLRRFVDWTRPEYKRASYRLTAKEGEGGLSVPFRTDDGVNSTNARGGFFLISPAESAVLTFKSNRFTHRFPVAGLKPGESVAVAERDGVTLEVRKPTLLPLIPHPLLEKEADFEAVVRPWRNDAPLQMRVVTVSGKIYRSEPVLPFALSGEAVSLPVWSETTGGPVSVTVSRSRVPEIVARLTPEGGATVATTGGPAFEGLAGGTPFDMAAFAKRHLRTAYPANAHQTAPAWVSEDGSPCLRFDGKGNFLYLPEETLPRGSFTLEFEIKPTGSSRPRVLCTARGYSQGALVLTLTNGELGGQWMDRGQRVRVLPGGLKVPEGVWSHIRVEYDLEQVRLTVNGQSATLPCPGGVVQTITPFIFGGYGNGKGLGYFSGYLRALRIGHSPAAATHPKATNFPLVSSSVLK